MNRTLAWLATAAVLCPIFAGCIGGPTWRESRTATMERYLVLVHPMAFQFNETTQTLSSNITLSNVNTVGEARIYPNVVINYSGTYPWSENQNLAHFRVDMYPTGRFAEAILMPAGSNLVINYSVSPKTPLQKEVKEIGISMEINVEDDDLPQAEDEHPFRVEMYYSNACIEISGSVLTVHRDPPRCETRYSFFAEAYSFSVDSARLPPPELWVEDKFRSDVRKYPELAPLIPKVDFLRAFNYRHVTYFDGEVRVIQS